MTLPLNVDSEDYKFYKTLNMDVQLDSVGKGKHWDINMADGDYINVTGRESLKNAIVIAIMTRFNELNHTQLYDGFGCRAHELIKSLKSELTLYKVELFVTEVLENMRRILEINELTVNDTDDGYYVYFNVTAINDEIVSGSVNL